MALGEWPYHRVYLGQLYLFLYSSSAYSCHFLISSVSVRFLPFLSFIVPILAWNIPGGAWNDISSFLEEISNFSHSVVFLYFFALFIEEGLLVSSCYSLDLCIQLDISFPFSLAFRFSYFHIYVGTAAHKESYSRVQGSSLVVTRHWNGFSGTWLP